MMFTFLVELFFERIVLIWNTHSQTNSSTKIRKQNNLKIFDNATVFFLKSWCDTGYSFHLTSLFSQFQSFSFWLSLLPADYVSIFLYQNLIHHFSFCSIWTNLLIISFFYISKSAPKKFLLIGSLKSIDSQSI